MTLFPTGAPFSHVTIDYELIRQLKYIDSANPLTNTFFLFLKSQLPYLDYYLSSIDFVEIPQHFSTTFPERLMQILRERQRGTLCTTEGAGNDPVAIFLGQGSVTKPLFIANEDRRLASDVFGHNPKLRKAQHLKLTDKAFQIEPLWHSLRKQVDSSAGFDCVLLSLGWEKVALASRLCQFYEVPVVDVGRYVTADVPSLAARWCRRVSAALQQVAGIR